MQSKRDGIYAVPTNIITGFLGAGKTSAILHLLQQKPGAERWAVLVNEFGEIGVDGSLLEGQYSEAQGVFVREVPGGCMCCAAGLPMQIALSQLLVRAKPDRLLIEPTGLGHPQEVLQALSAEHYREVLSIQKTLTLVDARKLSDARYTNHAIFNQQIAIADILIGNKLDLYADGDQAKLLAYVAHQGQAHAQVCFTQHGNIAISQLQGATAGLRTAPPLQQHKSPPQLAAQEPLPAQGFVKAMNAGEGFHSVGWRFSPEKVFQRRSLCVFLSSLRAERMKAVFITDDGVFGYNRTVDALTETVLDDCAESRIELIATELDDSWEAQLLACITE